MPTAHSQRAVFLSVVLVARRWEQPLYDAVLSFREVHGVGAEDEEEEEEVGLEADHVRLRGGGGVQGRGRR